MRTEYLVAEQTYSKYLPSLQAWTGWFVLVRDDRLGGVFHSYAAAAAAWMSLYGPVPALIRRIESSATATVAAEEPSSSSGPSSGVDDPPSGEATDAPHRGNWAIGWAPPSKAYAA